MSVLYKHSFEWLFYESGTHLLSHIVSNIVPSAAYVLTVVFGMGTGVSHKRISTGIFPLTFSLTVHGFLSAASRSIKDPTVSKTLTSSLP